VPNDEQNQYVLRNRAETAYEREVSGENLETEVLPAAEHLGKRVDEIEFIQTTTIGNAPIALSVSFR
jgi:hypothetical protein